MALPALFPSPRGPAAPPELRAVPALPAPPAAPERTHLIGPAADFWLLGGASAAFLFFCHFALKLDGLSAETSAFIFNLSFVVNYPHFFSSYQLLYVDSRRDLFRRPRFLWAGVISPVAILALVAWAVFQREEKILGNLGQALFFFVGWHYAKQGFGAIIVTNGLRKFFYSPAERFLVKANLLFIWLVSWTPFAATSVHYQYMGVHYDGLGIPVIFVKIAFVSSLITSALVLGMHILKYVREGKTPAPAAVAVWVASQAWNYPSLSHPSFALTVPFFHSLQYLVFVYAFRERKTRAAAGPLNQPKARARYFGGVYGSFAFAAVAGALCMWVIPNYFDTLKIAHSGWTQPSLIFNCATIFFNMHHYFVDHVLWRSDNEEIRAHLL